MKYICLECEHTFDIPRAYKERHGFKTPPYEKRQCCPACGGDFDEAVECDICGKAVAEGSIKELLGAYLCEECFKNEGGVDTDD